MSSGMGQAETRWVGADPGRPLAGRKTAQAEGRARSAWLRVGPGRVARRPDASSASRRGRGARRAERTSGRSARATSRCRAGARRSPARARRVRRVVGRRPTRPGPRREFASQGVVPWAPSVGLRRSPRSGPGHRRRPRGGRVRRSARSGPARRNGRGNRLQVQSNDAL